MCRMSPHQWRNFIGIGEVQQQLHPDRYHAARSNAANIPTSSGDASWSVLDVENPIPIQGDAVVNVEGPRAPVTALYLMIT